MSGGMTARGTLVSLVGALGQGLIAFGLLRAEGAALPVGVAALGFCGALLDSLLGAGVQTRYRCEVCGRLCERTQHCGRPTRRAPGTG